MLIREGSVLQRGRVLKDRGNSVSKFDDVLYLDPRLGSCNDIFRFLVRLGSATIAFSCCSAVSVKYCRTELYSSEQGEKLQSLKRFKRERFLAG